VTHPQVRPDPAFGLLKLYDDALPHVYGYLLARCGDTGLAEDLTAESFLAAVHAVRQPGAADPSIPWLIGVAVLQVPFSDRRLPQPTVTLGPAAARPALLSGPVRPSRHRRAAAVTNGCDTLPALIGSMWQPLVG